ncbi:MAG: 7-carboxy-7-deazaguanine synthase QueE [Planctomycetes bacterium]|nr:7-carboxy-7-deazaguanine synthase QueE [Planctomycetota bacterium]
MSEPTAPVFEIFSGIQGEGILVGVRQVFVRLCGCNRRCFYCDTQEALAPAPACAIEQAPGSRTFAEHRNPMTAAAVARAVAALDAPRGLHDSVSLTGGEPLLHADFIAALCPLLAKHGLPAYLETNGTLPEALERVHEGVQHVAMDIKLESATGQPTPWEAHYRFLGLALKRSVQVKVVVTADTTEEELGRVAELVGTQAAQAPVVLQPVTPVRGIQPPAPSQLLAFQALLKRRLRDVRVIPQVHRLMGQK